MSYFNKKIYFVLESFVYLLATKILHDLRRDIIFIEFIKVNPNNIIVLIKQHARRKGGMSHNISI